MLLDVDTQTGQLLVVQRLLRSSERSASLSERLVAPRSFLYDHEPIVRLFRDDIPLLDELRLLTTALHTEDDCWRGMKVLCMANKPRAHFERLREILVHNMLDASLYFLTASGI